MNTGVTVGDLLEVMQGVSDEAKVKVQLNLKSFTGVFSVLKGRLETKDGKVIVVLDI